jgi:hypothetical protein
MPQLLTTVLSSRLKLQEKSCSFDIAIYITADVGQAFANVNSLRGWQRGLADYGSNDLANANHIAKREMVKSLQHIDREVSDR